MNVPELRTPLEAALAYRRDFGLSVLAINPATKGPLIEWKSYQQEPASERVIREWFARCPDANVAIVTGEINDIWTVDIDSEAGKRALMAILLPTTVLATTSKGQHWYFKRPGPVRNTAKKIAGLDTRGDGGYVVAPPSRHVTGAFYTWANSPWTTPFALPPSGVVDLFQSPVTHHADYAESDYASILANGSPEGVRNSDAARLAGHYLAHGLNAGEVGAILSFWAVLCKPPFDATELAATINSVAQAEARKTAGEPYAPRASADRRSAHSSYRGPYRLEDVIHGYGVQLFADADWTFLRGVCPFHHDRGHNLWIRPSAQRWGCHKCDVKGDVETFLEMTKKGRM